MNVDHRRRFTFGITVENKDTRIWFACRQIVFVTEKFDINKVSPVSTIIVSTSSDCVQL